MQSTGIRRPAPNKSNVVKRPTSATTLLVQRKSEATNVPLPPAATASAAPTCNSESSPPPQRTASSRWMRLPNRPAAAFQLERTYGVLPQGEGTAAPTIQTTGNQTSTIQPHLAWSAASQSMAGTPSPPPSCLSPQCPQDVANASNPPARRTDATTPSPATPPTVDTVETGSSSRASALGVAGSSLLGHYRCVCGVPLFNASARVARNFGGFMCVVKCFAPSVALDLALSGATSPHSPAAAHFAAHCAICRKPVGYVMLEKVEIAADVIGGYASRHAHVLRVAHMEHVTYVGSRAPPEYREMEQLILRSSIDSDGSDADDDMLMVSKQQVAALRQKQSGRVDSRRNSSLSAAVLRVQPAACESSDDDDDEGSSDSSGDDDDQLWNSMRHAIRSKP